MTADIDLVKKLNKANDFIKKIKASLENFHCELDIYNILNEIYRYLSELND